MIEITLANCQVQVIANKDQGTKVMVFIDTHSGIKVIVPLNPQGAAQVSQALSGSGIIVPSLIPPPGVIKRNGG